MLALDFVVAAATGSVRGAVSSAFEIPPLLACVWPLSVALGCRAGCDVAAGGLAVEVESSVAAWAVLWCGEGLDTSAAFSGVAPPSCWAGGAVLSASKVGGAASLARGTGESLIEIFWEIFWDGAVGAGAEGAGLVIV